MHSPKIRQIPDQIDGYGTLRPYAGVCQVPAQVQRAAQRTRLFAPERRKTLADLDSAFAAVGLRDGAVISFHHHLRNGDGVLNMVLAVAARLGSASRT